MDSAPPSVLRRIADEERIADKLLKIEEVALIFGISRAATYRLLSSQPDELPIVKIGRSARVPASCVSVWIRRRTEESRGEAAS